MSVPFLTCMAAAAAFYHLPPRVLPAIQAVEGGRVGLMHMNANNTADLGVMQVNTAWIRPLASYAHMPTQAVAERLINDACFNVAASAAIMRVYLNESHGNLMAAIGYYHSHTPALSTAYQQKVLSAAVTLFAGNRKSAPAPQR
nr:lytic transglycosylase domain-containing protein [uncultured Rhodopila sp.]